MWLKLFISVETFHVCSLLLLNTGCHPDTWTQNVLWTLNVYTWSHLQCRYVWTPDRKCFFLLSVQAGISMSASVCLLVTLSKWIHQICLICVLTLKLLAITNLELTSQKPRWKRVFCGHENLVLTRVATASQWRLFAEVWINYIFCLNVVPGVTISSWTNQCPVLV